ncbi:MAG TPA: YdeI/OmpD-associated family protein [Allosphingosinicella sp.]|nr:YdeI/OmpD-associated family protein [Allosphingosinicella sp.]
MAAPTFFETEADFRRWLAAHHDSAAELLVGFWKKGSGKPSLDWPQARDQALCFGWIDGVRKSMGAESYTIRFTPRRKGSIWSNVNVARYEALTADGQMTPAGVRAYEENKGRQGVYAYENAVKELTVAETAAFRKNKAAWADWEARPAGYRRVVLHWIGSAKRPETRAKRLATLIEDSASGRKIAGYDIGSKKG